MSSHATGGIPERRQPADSLPSVSEVDLAAGVDRVRDRSVPPGVDSADLALYCLMLGDDALILSYRVSEWTVRAPELEEDVALAHIELDLMAQARMLLRRAGEVEGRGRDEDRLAFFRDDREFRNVRLVEIDCGPGSGGDFAASIARLLVLSSWRLALFERLTHSADPVLAAIAAGSLPALTQHRDHAGQWVLRLGDGDEESRRRMRAGFARVWPFIGELFTPHPVELRLATSGVAVDPSTVREDVEIALDEVLSVARLDRPTPQAWEAHSGPAGRDADHTEIMGFLLAEMQSVARSGAEAAWRL